jgi:hypothetical protein
MASTLRAWHTLVLVLLLTCATACADGGASDDADSDSGAAPATVTTLAMPEPAAAAKCMVVTADLLGRQDLAVDGVVTSIEDGVATVEVTRWYAGEETDVVEVEAPDADLTALIGAVSFEQEQRYLVAGNDGTVAPCGMSAPYSGELAAMYEEAFGA